MKDLNSRDALDGDERLLLIRGVSTRNYDPALGALADTLGLQQPGVSSAFQRAAQEDSDGINGRDLADWRSTAFFIERLGFVETTRLVAKAHTVDGHKHILDAGDGATENATVVADFLARLEDRGTCQPAGSTGSTKPVLESGDLQTCSSHPNLCKADKANSPILE